MITGPGWTDSTITSTPNSFSLISRRRDIASRDSGEKLFCFFSAASRMEIGGRVPSIAVSTNNGACFSFCTRLLGSAGLGGGGGAMTGAGRFSRSVMCLVRASSRSMRRSLTLACSRRSGTTGAATSFTRTSTSRNLATSCLRSTRALHQRLTALWMSSKRSRVIFPVRSMTLNQDRSVNTVRPNRNRAKNSSVLPCTLRALTDRWLRLSPRAPPAEAGRPAWSWKWISASAAPDSTKKIRPIRRQENSQPLQSMGSWRWRKTCSVLIASSSGKT
ncbi:hypothetical protein D9M68_651390 [compost metagenome]